MGGSVGFAQRIGEYFGEGLVVQSMKKNCKTKDALERNQRRHKVVITLNDLELMALDNYCEKHKSMSRASLLREIIMTEIIGEWERNVPMLFTEDEMR